jgi:hypothetical protein
VRERFAASRSRLCFFFPTAALRCGPLERLSTRRRRHTTRPRFLLLPSRVPPLPLALPLAAADHGRGKTPMRLGLQEGLGHGSCSARSRWRRGKDGFPALPLVAPLGAAMWPAANGGSLYFSITGRGKWGNLPLVEPLDRITGARELGVCANSAARASHPCARDRDVCRTVRAVRCWCWGEKGMKRKEKERLTCGPHTST